MTSDLWDLSLSSSTRPPAILVIFIQSKGEPQREQLLQTLRLPDRFGRPKSRGTTTKLSRRQEVYFPTPLEETRTVEPPD